MLNKLTKLKSTVRAKAKGHVNVAAASDTLMELLTLLFLNSLAEEARAEAFEEKSATIRAHHVRAVAKKILKKSRG